MYVYLSGNGPAPATYSGYFDSVQKRYAVCSSRDTHTTSKPTATKTHQESFKTNLI